MIRYVNWYSCLTVNYLQPADEISSTRRECLVLFSSVLVPEQRDTDFIYKELPYILCYVHTCLVSAISGYHITKRMADPLKFSIIAVRGFAARLNIAYTNKGLLVTHERELIWRDMKYFCKEAKDSAPIPASLLWCLTMYCRSIDAKTTDASYYRNEAVWTGLEQYWTEIKEYLWMHLRSEIDLDHDRDIICQFLWSYVNLEPERPISSAEASTTTTTTAQKSHALPALVLTPPESAPVPEPFHDDYIPATKKGLKFTPLRMQEDHKF